MGKLVAEAIGTFWLVLGGCGSAVLAAAYPELGIGFAGVSLAFGLTVLSMAAAIGHISGCHLNPAVTAGLVASGRFPAKDLPGYWIAQVLGGLAGAGVLYLVAKGLPSFDAAASGFASNGYGEHSPRPSAAAATRGRAASSSRPCSRRCSCSSSTAPPPSRPAA
jgi:aquaporin Z